MQNSRTGKAHKARERFVYILKETFRPHSKDEYAEVFTRGINKEEGTVTKKLPWLYIRCFALNLIIFAVLVLTFSLARYTAGYVTAILFGGLLFNIPLFIFFYELNPGRDLSLIKLAAVVIVGGVVATVVILLGYEYIYSTMNEPNPWISTLWVGFWEEFIKGIVAISAIALLKTKNPFACFLIGFAVGTGYSFAEDMGYIYSYSRSYGTAWLVLTSVGRGLSCVCSHAPWTAIIAWAYAKFKKPFLNFRFYGVVLTSMVLHYFADVPFFDENLNILRGVTVGWAIEAVVVVSIFVIVFLVIRSCLRGAEKSDYPTVAPLKKSAKLASCANLTAVFCAMACSVFALVGCVLPIEEVVVYANIYGEENFLSYVQRDMVFSADWDREFDYEAVNFTEFSSNGELMYATQKVTAEYDYYYVYVMISGGEPVLKNIGVKVDEKLYYSRRFLIYEDYYLVDGGYPISYDPVYDGFEIWDEENPDGEEDSENPPDETEEPVAPEEPEGPEVPEEPEYTPEEPLRIVIFFYIISCSCGYSVQDGCFTVYTGDTATEGLTPVYAVAALFGTTLVGGAVAFITLKIKSGRCKDD